VSGVLPRDDRTASRRLGTSAERATALVDPGLTTPALVPDILEAIHLAEVAGLRRGGSKSFEEINA
jgi:hypothetical protein